MKKQWCSNELGLNLIISIIIVWSLLLLDENSKRALYKNKIKQNKQNKNWYEV